MKIANMNALTSPVLTLVRKLSSEGIFVRLSILHPSFTKFIPHPEYYSADDNVVVEREGAKFSINRSDYMQWHIYSCQPDWSWKHAAAYLRKAKRYNPVIIDIGSNVGAFSFKIAANLRTEGTSCRIFAIDPNPYVKDKFEQNRALNAPDSEIHFRQLAISDQDGTSCFEFTTKNTGGGSISNVGLEVSVFTLDSFCSRNEISKVDFIKIDVEGFEPFVLDGARQTFAHQRQGVYMEISPVWYQKRGRSANEIFDYLYSLEYKVFSADEKDLKPIVKENLQQQLENFQFNILAIPQ
jgi:FkbM family methyltransferase